MNKPKVIRGKYRKLIDKERDLKRQLAEVRALMKIEQNKK